MVDTVGREATLQRAFRLTRAGGRIVGVGYSVDSQISLPTARFMLEEVELVGSRYVAMDELERAIRLVAAGRVQVVVDRVLPLDRPTRRWKPSRPATSSAASSSTSPASS